MIMRRMILGLSLVALSSTGCAHAFKASRQFNLSSAWEGYERIVVRSRNGDVSLMPGDGSEISIHGAKQAYGATPGQADEHVEQVEILAGADPDDPATFVIELSYPKELRWYSVGADFDVRIPQNCDVDIDTSNGDIVVRKLTGRVDLDSSNGSIEATDITGVVEARTGNGRIRAERIQGNFLAETSNGSIYASEIRGDCSFVTSNGRIEVDRIEGNVTAVTSNGTIRLEAVPPTDGSVVMRTSNGNIHVTLPVDIAARVKLKTSNGQIHTDFADAIIQRISFSRNRFECDLNGGEIGTVTARTSNGSIRITCR
ncbi:MAG: DUF4097 family beta strand repeat protein [Planctomycetes bacterium]|nr:DUF4097 family beta strand repeat protein [Planctomycetota bacterium]